MGNELTARWLRERGFNPEPEPVWITSGRKPDFFARGPADTWVEVKELTPPQHDFEFANAWNDLHDRCAKARANGRLYAAVGQFDPKAAKSVIKHVERIHQELAQDGPNYVVMIPGDPAYGNNVRLEYDSRDGKRTVQVGPASASGKYTCYPSLEPRQWSATVTLRAATGAETTGPLFDLLLGKVSPLLAVQVFQATEQLSLGGGHSEVRKNTSQDRIRRAVADCNRQIRNGQKFAQAPGLAVIHQDFPDALGPEQFVAAMFGDLAFEVNRDEPRVRRVVLTGNGVLTATDNRGVSAVRYVRRHADAVFVVNPHAEHALPWEHFAESAWVHDTDHYVLRQRASR